MRWPARDGLPLSLERQRPGVSEEVGEEEAGEGGGASLACLLPKAVRFGHAWTILVFGWPETLREPKCPAAVLCAARTKQSDPFNSARSHHHCLLLLLSPETLLDAGAKSLPHLERTETPGVPGTGSPERRGVCRAGRLNEGQASPGESVSVWGCSSRGRSAPQT